MQTQLPALPDGFVARCTGGACLVAESERVDRLIALGFGVDGDRGALPASDLAGRSPLGQLVDGDERLVIRRYQHGGLLRWLTGARFADPLRPVRELILAARLRELGVRTPAVVAARARPARPGWLLDLVSVRVEDSIDLGTALESLRAGELSSVARARLFEASGALIAQLHGVGLLHADLQPRNLLVERGSLDADAPRLWILDLDRSALTDSADERARLANLARLVRAVRRRESRGQPFLRPADLARFLRGYAGREWRSLVQPLNEAGERSAWRHRLGWWLERRVGADPAARDGAARVRS